MHTREISQPRARGLRFAGLLVMCWLGLMAGGSVIRAQSASPSRADQLKDSAPPTASIHVQSNLVTAPVTVIDRTTGSFVYDLTRNDFTIYDNGVAQRIERFDREAEKISVVIVVQTNDTVAPLLGQVKQVGPLFSQLMLGPKGEAAVLFYSRQIQVAQDFSNSGDELNTTLHKIKPTGRGARLNDALNQAMDLLEHRPKGERRVIVVFSTGYDSGSTTNKQEVIRRATSSEIEIYGLLLSLSKATLIRKPETPIAQNPVDLNGAAPPHPGVPTTPSSTQQTFGQSADITQDLESAARLAKSIIIHSDMEAYARYTGGVFYSQWSSTALQVHLNQIASELHSQYLLAYVPANLTKGFHQIKVKVNRPQVKVRTRLGYFYSLPE